MTIPPLGADEKRLFHDLQACITGEILTDATSRYLYSTDASYHLMVPAAVARPRDTSDLSAIAGACSAYNQARDPGDRMGLIMRSAGTSLTGGSIGKGLVVDVTKYFNGILDVAPQKRRVRVQPGVTYDELSLELSRHGLMFPPNPASGIACELGGMWANNASGTRHVKYGPTRNWVASLTGVSAQGETFTTGAVPATPQNPPQYSDAVLSRWSQAIWPLVRDGQEVIHRFTPRVNKNASGYALDKVWDGEVFDFAQLLVGSEGTLALFSEAELTLAPILKHRTVLLLFFDSWEKAGAGVSKVLPLAPVAVEMVDRHLLDIARPRSELVRRLVPDSTETALLVEFEGEEAEAVSHAAQEAVSQATSGVSPLAFDYRLATSRHEQEDLWAVRKSAAMIGHLTEGKRKPVPFIEDCVVPPEDLPSYIRKITAVFEKYQVHVAYWGHAGNGNMHVRPALDLTSPLDQEIMRHITDEVFAIVDSYDGSYTAEHGDGYTHAYKLAERFGELYPMFERVKEVCDPLGYLNPDKILTKRGDLLTADLRTGPETRIHTEAENHLVRDQVAQSHVDNCVGLGVCKDFCPSFIGLRNEQDLTRGRTNAIRGMMTGAFGDPDAYLRSKEFRAAGDTCLNCKRCAHQCPSQVDEPRHLLVARRYTVAKEGMPVNERLFSYYQHLAPWGVRLSTLTNALQRNGAWRRLLEWTVGIDARRTLPAFASETLDHWFARHTAPDEVSKGDVTYFAGCFARFNEPASVGRNTVRMAQHLGYRVHLPATGCSGHALETYGGDLGPWARHNIEVLEETGDAPILTTCSSCRLSLIKQYPEWFEQDAHWHARAQAVADRVVDAAYFGAQHLSKQPVEQSLTAYHAPCHALHLSATGHPGGEEALRQAPPGVEYIDMEQCCSGMGGTFGFKRKNRTIVETNAARMVSHLEPFAPDVTVYTDCPSCRMALDERTRQPTDHPVNAVYQWLSEEREDGGREESSWQEP